MSCNLGTVGGTKGVDCQKMLKEAKVLVFAVQSTELPLSNDGSGVSVLSDIQTLVANKQAMILGGIKNHTAVDTAETSQTLGDYTNYNDDEQVGETYQFVKFPCTAKALRAVKKSGLNGVYLITKANELIGGEVFYNAGGNKVIKPLKLAGEPSITMPNGLFAGTELDIDLGISFGEAKNLINSNVIELNDTYDDVEASAASGVHLAAHATGSGQIFVLLSDCAGSPVTDASFAQVGSWKVNGAAPTAVVVQTFNNDVGYQLTKSGVTEGFVEFNDTASVTFGENKAPFTV